MVRRDKEVTLRRSGGDELTQRITLKIPRQQQAATSCLNRQDQTLFIVIGGRRRWAWRRPQHSGDTLLVKYNPSSRSECLHRNPTLPQLREESAGSGRTTGQKGGRHHDLSHPEPLQQGWHPVEVVSVGMRKHQAVNHTDALRPQDRRE